MKYICETGPTVYSPYPRRLESLTILLQRQHFLLSYFKTLSEWSGRSRTPDLPDGDPVLNQLKPLLTAQQEIIIMHLYSAYTGRF